MAKRLILRTCNENLKSYNDFQWPKSGYVEAPDWEPTYKCGNGLHGLLEGKGDSYYLDLNESAKWLVVEVDDKDLLTGKDELIDKCKFKCGNVVFVGTKRQAISFIKNKLGHYEGVFTVEQGKDHSTLTAENNSILIAEYHSTLTAKDYSTLMARDCSTLTAGNYSTLTAGNYSTLTAKNDSTLTAENDSTLTGGYCSTLTAKDCSTLTAGNCSTLTAGHNSTLTAGNYSDLEAGNNSTLTAGNDSILEAGNNSIFCGGKGSRFIGEYFDGKRNRTIVAYVGEKNIKSNQKYKFINGKFKKVTDKKNKKWWKKILDLFYNI
jgi:hypothetical protein